MTHSGLLFRQVHPQFITPQEGKNAVSSAAFEIQSRAFTPNDRDEGKLSVDCSNLTTAEESYKLFKSSKRKTLNNKEEYLESKGVWAVSREICHKEGLIVLAAPTSSSELCPANNAHHLIDFSKFEKKYFKTIAKKLRNEAQEKGCLWPIE